MKVFVKTKAGAREERVEAPPAMLWGEKNEDGKNKKLELKVWVKEPPVGGKANVAIGKALAKHFGVAPSCVMLVSGASSKSKVFEINI